MALLLATSMPLSAVADDWYLDDGDISVNASESGQTVSQGTQSNIPDSAPVITQKDSTVSTSNSVTITAGENAAANVTLKDVNIDTSGTNQAAVEIKGGGNVTIELNGNNTVQSGDGHAGIEKNNSGNLTITDDIETDGSLEATGGTNGAGIGGGRGGNGSNITISGGTVTATGGEGGAGIGGGGNGEGSDIAISGGTVTANGGTDAAGIGGGHDGDGSNITISGGTVNATGGDPWQQRNQDGNVVEEKPGGGAGIGGGAYGEGNNITVKFNAQVTATGKGNAADIGNGYASEATEKQKDKVDLSGLSSFGKVNGVSGSDGGFYVSGSTSSVTLTVGKKATGIAGLTVSDNNGNDLSNVDWRRTEGTLNVTTPADNVLVTGNQADLLQLKEDGVKKINLQTNRVNVSVSNQVLDKITDSGGGFQLTADDTTVSLSSTDGNNQKTPGLKLTADKQPEKDTLQVDFRLAESKEGAGDVRESLNKTLQVSTNAPEATLSYDQKCLQTLLANSELGSLALAVGNLLATVDGMLGAITTVNGSGSISIGDNTVNMNGIQISANNSSGNSQLSQRIDEIMFQLRNQSQSGSSMMVTVNEKASTNSVSLEMSANRLQNLPQQGIEQTTVTVGDSAVSFNNSDVLEKLNTAYGSKRDSASVILENDRVQNNSSLRGIIQDNNYEVDISNSLLQQASQSLLQQAGQANGPQLSLLG